MKYSNKLMIITVLSALLVAPLSQAAQAGDYDRYYRDSSSPEIFGAIVGAAVGSQFGHGKGRGWTTAAGALLGWSIGHDMTYVNHGYENGYTDEPMDGYIDQSMDDYIDESMDDYYDDQADNYIYELEDSYM